MNLYQNLRSYISSVANFIKDRKSTIESIVRILEILILLTAFIITYSKLKDIIGGTGFNLTWFVLLMSLIGIAYFLLVIKEWIEQKFDLNRIIFLIYIIIFSFGLFASVVVYKNNQPLATLPILPPGTVGLRSYGCKVTFRNIEISYLDSNDIWQTIPKVIINDSLCWEKAFMPFNCKGDNYKPRYKLDSTLSITVDDFGVILNVSNPKVKKVFKRAEYFKVTSTIEVHSTYKKWADIQICMNVPLKGSNSKSQELYLGFSLPIKNISNSKFWIPALEWRAGNVYQDPPSVLSKNGIKRNLTINKEYDLLAVSFYNSARLMIKNRINHGVSILCESKYESKEMPPINYPSFKTTHK